MTIAIAVQMLVLAATLAGDGSPRRVVLGHSLVRLGDLVDLASVPESMRGRAALIEVARAPAQTTPLIVTRGFLLQRIHAQVPMLSGWADAHVTRSYAVSYRPTAVGARGGCLRALHDVAEGDILRSENFSVADCESAAKERSYRYAFAERAVRSRRAITAGTIVPRFAGYGVTNAYAGDRMMLVASSGSVRVERKTHALQSARRNERMFVRTDDGDVLSVRYAESGQ